MAGIELRSPSFNDHAFIPDRHARLGDDLSPSLEWSAVPEQAVELVLLCADPDAPNGTFLHWLVTGIEPTSSGVSEGATPPRGREWLNDFGGHGWGGPQPPVGDPAHRYFFRLYALDSPVRLPAEPTADDVQQAADGALGSGILVGLYHR